MTDKQIIDNIDVSECSYYANDKCINSNILQSNCKNVAVCYYKEYKRKEQECEELNKTITNLENIRDEFSIKLDQLKAENERLQEEREKAKNYNLEYGQLLIKATNKNNKLSKTLTEIKEIAQYDVYTSRTDLCIKLNWVKKKISEVK